MFGKKSIVSVLSLAALASCAPNGNNSGVGNTSKTSSDKASNTEQTVAQNGTKTIVIHKSYSLGESSATIDGSMVVENNTVQSITIDHPQGPIKTFADNISGKIVGKSIKWLKVDTISWASLTTTAFNEFLATLN